MTPDRAQELLRAFAGRRVLLIGDLMMDEWVFGSVARISPEAPIPVVKMPLTPEARAEKPGGAGNVGAILLGLGAAVRPVGVVGDDERGRRLADDLAVRGADVSAIVTDTSRPTTHKMRILAGRQQLLRIDTESADAISPSLAARLRDLIRAGLGEADVALVADYAKGVLSEAALPCEVIAEARAARIPFCADPKPANIRLFRGASLVSPNEAEALEAAALNGPAGEGPEAVPSSASPLPPAVLRAGRLLREQLEADAVFITRGEHGIAVFCPDGRTHSVHTISEEGVVGDGTGCGDAASAAAALALAAGADWLEAAELANAAGGVVSRFVGVHNPRPAEILRILLDHGDNHDPTESPVEG